MVRTLAKQPRRARVGRECSPLATRLVAACTSTVAPSMTITTSNPYKLPKRQRHCVGYMPTRIVVPTFALPTIRQYRECVGDQLLMQPTVQNEGAWPADASQRRPRACPMNSPSVTCVWNRLGLVPVRVGPVCRGVLPGSWVSYDAAPPRRDSATGSCDEGAGSCSAQYVCMRSCCGGLTGDIARSDATHDT